MDCPDAIMGLEEVESGSNDGGFEEDEPFANSDKSPSDASSKSGTRTMITSAMMTM